MSVTTGPNLGKIINAATGDSFDAYFRALLRAIDVLLQGAVISRTLTAPPGSPTNGDRYIVGASPTGAWAGNANNIAVWTTDNPSTPSGLWEFYTPKTGWIVYSVADTAYYFWNGTAWTNAGGGTPTLAGDSDVSISGPTNNQVLTYNSGTSKWVNATHALANDSDVSISGPANNQVLTYNSGTSKWGNATPTLAADSDVAISSPSNGQVLTYDSGTSKWKNAAASSTTLAGDTDVAISSPTNGQVLTYDSGTSKWKNAAATGGSSQTSAQSAKRIALIALDGSGTGSIVTSNKVGDTPNATGSSWTDVESPTSAHGLTSSRNNSTTDTYAGWYGSTQYRFGRHVQAAFGVYINRTTDIRAWIGLHDSPSGLGVSDNPSGNYAMFRFSAIGGDTHWQCITKDGTTQTIVDSGITPDTNEHRFGVECDDDNSQIKFYIDGSLVATISTHLPSSGTLLKFNAQANWHTATANPIIGASHFRVEADF